MALTTYKEKVRRLSQAIVEAQRPIRILDAIKWTPEVEQKFRKSKFRELPQVGPEFYATMPVGFDIKKKREELQEIIADINRTLGEKDQIGGLLKTISAQYIEVTQLLEARGTKAFGEYSKKLYGSPKDHMYDGKNTICDLGQVLYEILSGISDLSIGPDYPENIQASEVVKSLNERFQSYFPSGEVGAKLSDGIVADAAAGGDTVKIRDGALFSARDIDILEVHEGWVHVGTTQNGNLQHVARWLSKGPPRVSSTQEGLAVIMEIFTFRSYPKRAKQINDRILGIDKAEDGANFLELFDFYRSEGYTEEDCLTNAKRVFRGGLVEGGAPFTKDLSYCRGFIENYNFMRAAIRLGKPQLIPFLFTGKLHVDDVPLLYRKHQEGLIDAPHFLPPQFKDMNGLAVWMSFSSFLNLVDLKKIQEHYSSLFKQYL